MKFILLSISLITLLVAPSVSIGSEPENFEKLLNVYCVRCHGPELSERDLNLNDLSRNFALSTDAHLWAEVVERINSGEMPPADEPQPTISEIAATVTELTDRLREGKAARLSARPPIAHYRLSRTEYENTVYDLLGVRYDPAKPGELNEDTRWLGYDRIGSQLSLSSSHIDRYYRAAETVLNRAFPLNTSEPRKVTMSAADLRYGGGKEQIEALQRFGITRPLRYLLFPGRVQTALASNWFGQTGPEHSGLYKLRLQASGIRPIGGQPAHLSIGKQTSEETVDGIIEFDITASEDEPQVFEFEVFLEMPATLHFSVVSTDVIDRRQGAAFRNALTSRGSYLFTHSSETKLLNPNAPQMFDDQGNGIFSTVILDWVEWEGPIVSDEEQQRREGIIPSDETFGDLSVVESHLKAFASRAWRRPVKPTEMASYMQSYKEELDAGESPENAYRLALQGILTSRHFIYLIEGDETKRTKLSDSELAARLSYFLWSSMPDPSLAQTVLDDRLSGPDDLMREVDRMLADHKTERFVNDFTQQWLQLHRVGMFPPDRKLYPRYDEWLEASMKEEPIEFFREVFNNNLPIDQLIDADWTMANARLCDFYQLPEPESGEFQRVILRPEDRRGGLLTMGAILGLTSDGTRHRPVHRGVWVSETIFNRTPPPPPANVDPIEPVPPEGDKITVRKRIEAHATNASCAACHQRIDPLGLAFDHYDAIGQWRERESMSTGQGEDPPVDASGKLQDGRSFNDSAEFKALLLEDREQMAKAFIEHLSTYALRRVLSLDDQDDIQLILDQAKQSGYRVKDIVRAVATSDLIRKR